MTTTRELLQQALDALEEYVPKSEINDHYVGNVVTDIRAHLAKPGPTPFAWIKKSDLSDIWQQEPLHPENYIPLYAKESK